MSLAPGSGRANNFSKPAAYTVTGVNGRTRTYTVIVNPVPSSTKDITGFKFSGVPNTETIIGAAPDGDGTYPISVHVPGGLPLNSLAPTITHTGVSISPAGGTALDFSGPRTYTVTAEDGSKKIYKVTVYPAAGDAKLITSFIFDEVPLSAGGTVRVVASIDQSDHTITAMVPYTADISALTPVVTYIGRSITPYSGTASTGNPFTDVPRNFENLWGYTVNNQAGDSQLYTVIVTKQTGVTVTFQGESEIDVIDTKSFDPAAGIITVTVKTGNVDPPYGWYVNGVKQLVPDDTAAFKLNVGNGAFIPGPEHEIMVSGKKDGMIYTGHVKFTVSGGIK
jgi:hypothetical protein